MFEVLKTAKRVAEKSRHVQIDHQALVAFTGRLAEEGVSIPPWENLYHFNDGGEETVSYLLVLDSLNFCFWPEQGREKWEITHERGPLSGYYGLAMCLKRAVESGVPITRPEFLAELSFDGLKKILKGRGELQLLNQRHEILNELGKVLLNEYDGKACRLVEAAEKSALRLVRLLGDRFDSFRDVAVYEGFSVFFYKRAQIFAADLYGAFQGKKWGLFTDMDELTTFADYKVPQVLRHLGILNYTPNLAQKIDQKILIEVGSPEEIEIRANTIWTVEQIRGELKRMGKEVRAFEIDWILWNLGQHPEFKEKPYHRTVTIFY